ncbi:MAG TPA: chemotaxis protein CheX [Phycisphaerae bacterium]|nr:chemotaxis protein CheX [Phycisphaerales bacterium]HRX84336.1 chemotaxis protein CheX [Phycisphaerae bacterium]
MDVKFINPFIQSVVRVFETMVHVKMSVGKPYLKSEDHSAADVSGIIGFSGDAAGAVVISFSTDVACKSASQFAGITIDPQHPDFADAIGELANMVAGNAKKEFTDLNIKISLPSVVIGKQFTVSNSRTAPRIVIPCKCELGDIYVEVAMEVMRNPATGTPKTAAVGA